MAASLPRFCFHSTTGKALTVYMMLFFLKNEIVGFISKYLAGSGERVVDESDDQGLVTLFRRWHHSDSRSGIEANGFKSHVRQSILEFGNHKSHASHSKNCAYHGIILMQNAMVELGEDMAANTEMHLGLDGHVEQSLLNGYVDTWVSFDMLDHPASTYAKERKISIGDAAHSTSPYHGSGAGFANEDFAVLAELLVTPAVKAHNGLRAMFQAFELCRCPRTQ
ncbi:hypothetical protein BTUL_0095g00440 [Botrytis tulipae]|uniref:FAD-binding domain-containing protein n=1 Tax=Botrytis tulipae TaxID=87230 RepID=A0A4Z1EIA8_9HELO|nr:hypothetical protein BTUL_0095g00440 [Botrytis tulipae]